VTNNAEKAERAGMNAHSTVVLRCSQCPECGRMYVSGGTTTTTYSPKWRPLGDTQEACTGLFLDVEG
jgi:hypothetical protein